jgi:hypothetical protein
MPFSFGALQAAKQLRAAHKYRGRRISQDTQLSVHVAIDRRHALVLSAGRQSLSTCGHRSR